MADVLAIRPLTNLPPFPAIQDKKPAPVNSAATASPREAHLWLTDRRVLYERPWPWKPEAQDFSLGRGQHRCRGGAPIGRAFPPRRPIDRRKVEMPSRATKG